MNAKKRLMIVGAAVIPTAAAIAADFGLFYALLRVTTAIIEHRVRALFAVCVVLLLLGGLVFPAAEWITWMVLSKTGAPEKKVLHIASLIGAAVFALMMALVFPKSLKLLFVYLPKSEHGPGLSLLFFQLFSYAGAVLCGIVHAAALCLSKK